MGRLTMTVSADKKNADWMRMFGEWEKRIAGVTQEFPRRVAEDVLAIIMSRAPQGRIDDYPQMLSLKQLPDKDGWKIIGILPPAWAFSQRLKTSDMKRTVLDIFPKVRAGVAVSEAAVILSRKNPWTMDTLPYEASKQEAAIRSRRVTEREVRKIEERRKRDRKGVEIELKDAGFGGQLRPEGKVLLSRKVSRDIAFEVMKVEFGNGVDGQPVAHWRPALGQVTSVLARKHFKDLIDWLADPDERRYLRPDEPPLERGSAMKMVQDFQDRVTPG